MTIDLIGKKEKLILGIAPSLIERDVRTWGLILKNEKALSLDRSERYLVVPPDNDVVQNATLEEGEE